MSIRSPPFSPSITQQPQRCLPLSSFFFAAAAHPLAPTELSSLPHSFDLAERARFRQNRKKESSPPFLFPRRETGRTPAPASKQRPSRPRGKMARVYFVIATPPPYPTPSHPRKGFAPLPLLSFLRLRSVTAALFFFCCGGGEDGRGTSPQTDGRPLAHQSG